MINESSRQGFLDTILAEPAEESHRLIYADWLEDNGDLNEAEKFRTLHGLAAVWSTDWGKDNFGLWCTLTFKQTIQRMRWIPPGSFLMGSPRDEEEAEEPEGPQHEVTLTHGFWMADTPCSQEAWLDVMPDIPTDHLGKHLPVTSVSWFDCQEFLSNCNDPLRGLHLSLPTEAQWERACRAGTEGPLYRDDLEALAWHWENSGEVIRELGTKQPNDFGLYDILGNVWEWCRDGRRAYRKRKEVDPIGPEGESLRIVRGHCWLRHGRGVRATRRHLFRPGEFNSYIGFRPVVCNDAQVR